MEGDEFTTGPPLGSGRYLRSASQVDECLAALEDAAGGSLVGRPGRRSPLFFPGWIWLGDQETAPDRSVMFKPGGADIPTLAMFWDHDGDWTYAALVPPGFGDERLRSLDLVERWRAADPTLEEEGILEGGMVALTAPALPDNFFDDIATSAGLPATAASAERAARLVAVMLLSKACEYVDASDPGAADRFGDAHHRRGTTAMDGCQAILDDLVAWNVDALPLVQDLPERCRALAIATLADPLLAYAED